MYSVAVWILMLAGLLLALVAMWPLRLRAARCPVCKYPRVSDQSTICPECGFQSVRDNHWNRGRPRYWLCALAILLVGAGLIGRSIIEDWRRAGVAGVSSEWALFHPALAKRDATWWNELRYRADRTLLSAAGMAEAREMLRQLIDGSRVPPLRQEAVSFMVEGIHRGQVELEREYQLALISTTPSVRLQAVIAVSDLSSYGKLSFPTAIVESLCLLARSDPDLDTRYFAMTRLMT